jgi:hypothetical protein
MASNGFPSRSRWSTRVTAIVAALLLSGLAMVTTAGSDAFAASMHSKKTNVKKACKSLAGLESDLADISGSFTADTFDEGVFKKVGAAFTKASRNAPKNVKGTLKSLGKLYTSISKADNPVDAGLRFSKNAQEYSTAVQEFAAFYATKCVGSNATSSGSSSGSGGGTLTLPDETITLKSSQCYLKKQTSAGQDIELTAQATGTNSAGDDVNVDFTRYADSSSFAGDDITVLVGQPGASDATDLSGRLDRGTVDRSGDTFTIDDAQLRNESTGDSVTISFEINC